MQQKTWVQLYHEALLETDPQRLQELITAAQNAVQQRVMELLAQAGEHQEERRALADALQNLRVLRQEKL